MTREEAINIVQGARQYLTAGNPIWDSEKVDEAMKMAIEALSEETIEIKPIEIKGDFHIDDDYKKPPQIIGNVEIVVRCKDCRYRNGKVNRKGFEVCDATGMDITDDDYYSLGERREE